MQTNYSNQLKRVSEKEKYATACFLDKYGLPFDLYQSYWQDKVNIIFPQIGAFEKLSINKEYYKTIAVSGSLITESTLSDFYQIMRITGDTLVFVSVHLHGCCKSWR